MDSTNTTEAARRDGSALERGVRAHALDIRNCGGDDGDTLMSKGHHDKATFLKACEEYWGEPLTGFDEPAHMWWRSVPDSTGEYRCIFHEAKPHARGAFPVTAICRW